MSQNNNKEAEKDDDKREETTPLEDELRHLSIEATPPPPSPSPLPSSPVALRTLLPPQSPISPVSPPPPLPSLSGLTEEEIIEAITQRDKIIQEKRKEDKKQKQTIKKGICGER